MPRTSNVKPAIFISVDARFAAHWEQFQDSLARNWPNYPEVLVALHDRGGALEDKLRATPRYRLLDSDIFCLGHGPVMAHLQGKVNADAFYSRLALWGDSFSEYDTILHLDVDTIVLRPLDDLVMTHDFQIAVDLYQGDNYLFNNHRCPELQRLLREDGIAIPSQQANAGIFTMPRKYRSPEYLHEIELLLERYRDHLRWADQSLINIWMVKHGVQIRQDLAWNFQARAFTQEKVAGDRLKVLHFNGISDPHRVSLMKAANKLLQYRGGWAWFRNTLRDLPNFRAHDLGGFVDESCRFIGQDQGLAMLREAA